jgi:hypothetical protein
MKDEGMSLNRQLVERERERLQNQALPSLPVQEQAGIHHTQLPEDASDRPLACEWNVYRREIGRLLAEGHEGRYVLIKGETVLGLFETWDLARTAGLERFLREPFFVHPVSATEPHLRLPGINHPWPSSALIHRLGKVVRIAGLPSPVRGQVRDAIAGVSPGP